MSRPRNALAVREAIEAGHLEILIVSPLTSRSSRWELTTSNGMTTFDDFWMLVDFLAARYDIDPDSGLVGRLDQPDDEQPADRYVEIQVVPERD